MDVRQVCFARYLRLYISRHDALSHVSKLVGFMVDVEEELAVVIPHPAVMRLYAERRWLV